MIDALQFLPAPPDESLLYAGSYDPAWVVISVLLAVLASYAALNAYARTELLHDATSKLIWTFFAALTLGIGVWAMHFIGMLAMKLPCGIYYDPVITLISMIPGIMGGGVALGVVWNHGTKHLSPLLGSILLGAGIGTMHYTGMAAMQLEGFVRYDPSLFALSIIVAVGLSYLALRVKNGVICLKKRCNLLVAVIMGGAVSGMHYTAMSAAYFVRGDVGALPPSLFTTNALAILVAITTVFLALGALALASISHNREMAGKLRDSEQQFRQLSENIHEVFWMTDPAKDQILYISPAYEQVWGRTVQSLHDAPQSWMEAIHGEDRQRVVQAALTKQVSGLYNEEYRIVRPNGDIRWIHDQAFPVRDSGGAVYRIAGVAEDITERKLAEQSKQDQQARLNGLIEAAMDAIVTTDENQNIIIFNPAAEQMFGYRASEIIGRPLDLLLPIRFRTIHGKHVDKFGQTGHTTRTMNMLGRTFGLRRNGDEFPIDASISAIKVAGNLIYTAILRDTTSRNQAEADLRIAATAFETHESLMITDAHRVILRVNLAFIEETGYTAAEVVGQTPRLLRSGRHDAAFYHAMWATLREIGTWQGEVWDRRKNGEIYPKWLTITAVKDAEGVVTHYVGSHIDITERKFAEKQIAHLAFYDPLTNLPNRRLLMDRVEHALSSSTRTGRKVALLFIDLDNFKTLNDTRGHDLGDLLLQQVALRLTSGVREGDTVARLGGDEFVVVLENLSEEAVEAASQTEAICDKILAMVSQPYQLGEHEFSSTCSIGATLITGHHTSISDSMKQSDIAMYQAKRAGRNTMRFFDPQMQAAVNVQAALEHDLRQALEKQQFQLHYQIQVSNMNKPLGAEALIRWIHPERGFVTPMQFIPLAEETDLILPIGQWVLDTACAQLKAWEQNALTRNLVLSVNVSARQFRQAKFVSQVQATVQRHAINPKLLKVELTEGMLIDNVEGIIATMNILNEMGIQISLDDFGTGYSSLQYLQRLPMDQLKIDMSFVRGMSVDGGDNAIVQTIIAMAHSLKLDVIAEGVETEAQRQLLSSYGCHHYQGYLFSKPVPIAQFEALLKQG